MFSVVLMGLYTRRVQICSVSRKFIIMEDDNFLK